MDSTSSNRHIPVVDNIPPIIMSAIERAPRNHNELMMICQRSFLSAFQFIHDDRTEGELLLPALIKLMKLLIEVSALGFESDCHEKLPFWVDKMNRMPPASKLSQQETSQLKKDLACGYSHLQSVIVKTIP